MRSAAVFALVVLLTVAVGVQSPGAAPPLKIITGTSLIEDIVRDLTEDQGTILTISQGSACPGHEHIKTGDVVFAAEADLLLLHGFQRTMPHVAPMLNAVENKKPRVVFLETSGSWLIPENQRKASREVAAALMERAPEQASRISVRLEHRLARTEALERACLAMLAPVKGKAVLAAAMQAEFATWAGLRVLQRYGRAEDLSAGALARMLRAVQGKQVRGVIDNRQSGSEAGLPLALELHVPHIVLSNFPGSDAAVPDYFSLMRANVQALSRL